MNGIIIEKYLCQTGKELEQQIDELIREQKLSSTNKSNEIYKALKNYFHHKKDCFDCEIVIRNEKHDSNHD